MNSGKGDEAFASVQNLVQQNPNNAGAQLLLGRMLLRKGDWAGASAALEKATAGLPRDAAAHAGLGTAYQFTRRAPEALAAYKKAVELDPKNLDYRTTYGIMLGINKDYEGGVAELKKVIESPGYKSPDAYLNLGWLYRNMTPRKPEESVAAYKKALELDPTNEQAALGMAWAYSYSKQYADSMAAFTKAMELEPDLAADAYNGIAWGHFFQKDLAAGGGLPGQGQGGGARGRPAGRQHRPGEEGPGGQGGRAHRRARPRGARGRPRDAQPDPAHRAQRLRTLQGGARPRQGGGGRRLGAHRRPQGPGHRTSRSAPRRRWAASAPAAASARPAPAGRRGRAA